MKYMQNKTNDPISSLINSIRLVASWTRTIQRTSICQVCYL